MTAFPRRIFLGVVWGTAGVLAASIAPPAHARTIYVREAGDDANDGLSAVKALRTIGRGAALAVAEDTVLVGPGTYFEGDLGPAAFGQVRFLADRRGEGVGEPPGDVMIDATGFTSGFELNGKLAMTIDGFVICGGSIGIYVKSGSHGAVISNNIVSHNNTNGIYVQDSRDAVIFNNLVYNNGRSGILITGNDVGSAGAKVLNNTVYRNLNRGIFFSGTTAGSPNSLVLNNIAEKNAVAGIQVNVTSRSGYLSAGNVLFDNDFASGTPVDVTDQRNTDPLFIDPDGADDALGGINYADDNFRLQQKRAGQGATSPAVDAGSDLSRRLNLLRASTRSDGRPDRGIVDAGYHYGNFGQPPATPEERIRPKKLYVSQANGDDANLGATRETAVRTLKRAFALADPGHLIAVIGGIYSEGQLSLPSGKPGRPIILKAINGARINGLTGQSGLLLSGVSHVTLDGLRISGAGESGVDIRSGSSDITLRRCRLSANSRRGLSVKGSAGIQVISSIIESNGSRGVQVESSAVSIDRSSIGGNVETGLWVFGGSTVAVSKTEFSGNRTDGILVEQSEVSVVGGTIKGSVEGGARFKDGSNGSLENVEVLDNTDVGVQAISSVVSLSGGSVRGNSIGVQSFVDPISQTPVALSIDGTRVCDNRAVGIDAQATALTSVGADLCANGREGLRQRGGSADMTSGKVRANLSAGISTTDATRLMVSQVVVSDNQGNGVQVVRVADVDIENSVLHDNDGDGLTILDSPSAEVVNNLVYGNGSSGILISGDSVGSPDARVAYNTLYRNTNRGLFIGGADNKPASPYAVVTGNIFRMNGNAGIQVNTLSLVGYEGDFNLSTDPYGANTEPGLNDVFDDPLFVAPDTGDFHLSQTAAGQDVSSPAVNRGSTTAAASGMATKTTRTDKVVDQGVVDLGYHYLP